MYSNLLQNWRGGSTLKEKFSSSPCQGDKEKSLWLKNFWGCKWDFFFLLLIFLFRDTKRYSHWSNPGSGYTLKKSSRRLVDKEIFLTHWAKLCLIICNKCIVIYYKIEGEGLPSKRSFLRLLANETKKYLFEGTPCPCILSLLNQLVCLLAPCPLGASRQTIWFKGLKIFRAVN